MVKYYSDQAPLRNNKNFIINGNMEIWQRGTGPFTTSGDYTADRWRYTESSSGSYSISRSTDVPSGINANYSAEATVVTADTSVDSGDWLIPFHYTIEGVDFLPLVGKTATLSFWVKSNLTGTYSVSFRNSGADRSYVIDYTIDQANTWERKILTITFDFSGGTWTYDTGDAGCNIYFTALVGSDRQGVPGSWLSSNCLGSVNQVNWAATVSNTLNLTHVQLEFGNVATDFDYRIYSDELARCQRYYYNCANDDLNKVSFDGSTSGQTYYGSGQFPCKMAVQPTITVTGTSESGAGFNGIGTGDITVDNISVQGFRNRCTAVATDAGNNSYGFSYTADGELI